MYTERRLQYLKVIREAIESHNNQNNIPRINGTCVDVLQYRNDFLNGFEGALYFFQKNIKKLEDWLESSVINKSRQRQLFK